MTITDKQLAALRTLCEMSKNFGWVSTYILDIEMGCDGKGRNAGLLLSCLVRARPALAEKRPGRQIGGKWRLTAYRPTAEGRKLARGRA